MEIDFENFINLRLPGGFVLTDVTEIAEVMIDPVGRPAVAKTIIEGREIWIILSAGMSDLEQSISIYHEVLEGLTVAMDRPPRSVENFLEHDFEAAAASAHAQFGFATAEKVVNFLQMFGFQ